MSFLGGLGGGTTAGNVYPFGGEPAFQALGQYRRQFATPGALGLGLGAGEQAQRFGRRLEAGRFSGPLGPVLQELRAQTPNALADARGAGGMIAGQAPMQYAQIRANLEQALAAQPGLLNSAQGGVNLANQMVSQVSDPSREDALYQRTAQRFLDPIQQNASARGLLDAGSTQGFEQEALRDLAMQFGLREQELQSNAIQSLGGALGNYNQTGIGGGLLGQQLFELAQMYPQLAMMGSSLPINTASQLMQLFQGSGGDPLMQLIQALSPQVATTKRPDYLGAAGSLLGGIGGALGGFGF